MSDVEQQTQAVGDQVVFEWWTDPDVTATLRMSLATFAGWVARAATPTTGGE